MTDIQLTLSAEASNLLAKRIAALAVDGLSPPSDQPERWLTAGEAAEHLGISVDALHKRTSAREIPFSQERPGGRLYFKRAALDAWREARQ